MKAVTFGDANAFLDALRPLIVSQPARCTTVNTVLHNHLAAASSAKEPIMAAVLDNSGALVAAALQTPPYPLTVVIDSRSAGDVAVVATLAAAVQRKTTAFTAISGPAADTDAFAAAWFDLTGAGCSKSRELLLHRLGVFAVPRGVAGSVREGGGRGRGGAGGAGRRAGFVFGVFGGARLRGGGGDLPGAARAERRRA